MLSTFIFSIVTVVVLFLLVVTYFICSSLWRKMRLERVRSTRMEPFYPEAIPVELPQQYIHQQCAEGNALIDAQNDILCGQSEFFEVVTTLSNKDDSRDNSGELGRNEASIGEAGGGRNGRPNRRNSPQSGKKFSAGENPLSQPHKGGQIIREVSPNGPDGSDRMYLRRLPSTRVYGRAHYTRSNSAGSTVWQEKEEDGPNVSHSVDSTKSVMRDEDKKKKIDE
ncbi:hypothetical protein BCY84_16251 [Trypanosoma cruzi cruzi]|nr:hypothetical protein BCY84_16251 [Trypanosoma cruzi cruzi]